MCLFQPCLDLQVISYLFADTFAFILDTLIEHLSVALVDVIMSCTCIVYCWLLHFSELPRFTLKYM